jgi:hypothetical protein
MLYMGADFCESTLLTAAAGRGARAISITMKKIRILLSLTTNDNDYQIEQAASAEETARKLGVHL